MPRVDAQRNIDALLAAAKEEFAERGVDVGVRSLAARAGVGTATLYRHFPSRSDLVIAVFRAHVDACVAEGLRLAATCDPEEALCRWVDHYAAFIAANRGLAKALESGDPAFAGLPDHFRRTLGPVVHALLDRAASVEAIRSDVDPVDLLAAIAKLSVSPAGDDDPARAARMIGLLVDGLRYGAGR